MSNTPKNQDELHRLVQSPDKSRWYYLEHLSNSDRKTDVTLEVTHIINSEVLKALEKVKSKSQPLTIKEYGEPVTYPVVYISAIEEVEREYRGGNIKGN